MQGQECADSVAVRYRKASANGGGIKACIYREGGGLDDRMAGADRAAGKDSVESLGMSWDRREKPRA